MGNNNVKSPLVSIRCLVYNHEPFLRECLDGFIMQKTEFTFEVIVHDDASTDGSAAIIREYAEKYPHLARLDRWTTEGSVTYVLDKSRVSIRLLPPLSEERRRVFSECGKKYGMNASRRLLEQVAT